MQIISKERGATRNKQMPASSWIREITSDGPAVSDAVISTEIWAWADPRALPMCRSRHRGLGSKIAGICRLDQQQNPIINAINAINQLRTNDFDNDIIDIATHTPIYTIYHLPQRTSHTHNDHAHHDTAIHPGRDRPDQQGPRGKDASRDPHLGH